MASGKKNISDNAILNFLLSGVPASELSKKTKITNKDIARVLLSNPQAFTELQKQAQRVGLRYNEYDPTRYYMDPNVVATIQNPITEKYKALGYTDPNSALFAKKYFDIVAEQGNNPNTMGKLSEDMRSVGKEIFGLSDQQISGLLTELDADRNKWFEEELSRKRALEKENYQAFSKQRAEMKIPEGQTATEATFGKATGLAGLANVPRPDLTFQQQASLLSSEKYIPQAKGRTADVAERMGLAAAPSIKAYEKAFMGELKKRGKEKSSPFKETVKKLLPSILAKKELGL